MRVTKDKAISLDTSTLLTVVVGVEPNVKHFSLHEGFLCTRSKFFRLAMSGDWAEREERLINLPDDTPDVFAIYSNLVYTNNVATGNNASEANPDFQNELSILSKLYVLCEKLCDAAAKNSTVEAILVACGIGFSVKGALQFPSTEAVQIMYQGTPKGSHGRKLMADLWTGVATSNVSNATDELPKEFLVDLAVALLKDRPPGRESVAKRVAKTHYLENVV